MQIEKLKQSLLEACSGLEKMNEEEQQAKIESILNDLELDTSSLTMAELKTISDSIVTQSTKTLNKELQELLFQKEKIDRELEKKSHELQSRKHQLFAALEEAINKQKPNPEILTRLHRVELQSIDLLDFLGEMVESAIITTLEKGSNIEETLEELSKEITIQTLNEGILSAGRIRHVIYTILKTAIDVAQATPNMAHAILEGTIKGTRGGLVKALDRFKQKFMFTPDEAKMVLIEDAQSLYNELHHADSIFIQTIESLSAQSPQSIKIELESILADTRYNMEDLTLISKETLELVGEKLTNLAKEAVQKSSTILQSKKAQDAKKMGVHAWSIARSVLDGAIKGAKDAMDKKDKS